MAITMPGHTANHIQASDEELQKIRATYVKKNKSPLPVVAGRVGFWLLIVAIIVYTLFPFYWAVVSSLTPAQ